MNPGDHDVHIPDDRVAEPCDPDQDWPEQDDAVRSDDPGARVHPALLAGLRSSADDGAALPRPAVTWVRPSDLPRQVGMQALGWGIGHGMALQASLTRAVTHAPRRATAALGRRAPAACPARREAPAGPEPAGGTAGAEGVSLP